MKGDKWKQARKVLADFIPVYLQHLSELELLRSEARHWSALHEIGQTLTSILDLDPLLEKIVDFAIDITQAERGFILLPATDEGIAVRTARGRSGTSLDSREFAVSESIVRRVLKEGREIVILDTADAPEFGSRESVLSLGLRSVLCVPLIHHSVILGAVYVDSQTKRKPFSENAREMLQALAAQAAVAIVNSRLYRELEERTAERERSRRLASLGTMAAGIAHEIRNPLGIISNAVYFLDATDDSTDPDRKEQFSIINQEIQRANRIIDDLLDYSRIRPPKKKKTDLCAVIRECAARAEQSGKVHKGRIRYHFPRTAVRVAMDADQMRQVFMNLFENAGREITPLGWIDTTVQMKGREVEIRVENDGPPIDPEILPRIFEPFFSTRQKGAGLGLSIIQTIIHLHGGRIEAKNITPEKGCVFIIAMPVK